MGLMLSTLVFCVGVLEVLECWRHFLRHLTAPAAPRRLHKPPPGPRRLSPVDICWPRDLTPDDHHLHVSRRHDECAGDAMPGAELGVIVESDSGSEPDEQSQIETTVFKATEAANTDHPELREDTVATSREGETGSVSARTAVVSASLESPVEKQSTKTTNTNCESFDGVGVECSANSDILDSRSDPPNKPQLPVRDSEASTKEIPDSSLKSPTGTSSAKEDNVPPQPLPTGLPVFPEITLHESSPPRLPEDDSDSSSLNTSDASWMARSRASDRPLKIRFSQSPEDIAQEFISVTKTDLQAFGGGVVPEKLPEDVVDSCNVQEQQCVGVIAEDQVGISDINNHKVGSPPEEQKTSFPFETTSSSSSLSGIPQLPEDSKDPTPVPLPSDNGYWENLDSGSERDSGDFVDRTAKQIALSNTEGDVVTENSESCDIIFNSERNSCDVVDSGKESCFFLVDSEKDSLDALFDSERESCRVLIGSERESLNDRISSKNESCDVLVESSERESLGDVKDSKVESRGALVNSKMEFLDPVIGPERESKEHSVDESHIANNVPAFVPNVESKIESESVNFQSESVDNLKLKPAESEQAVSGRSTPLPVEGVTVSTNTAENGASPLSKENSVEEEELKPRPLHRRDTKRKSKMRPRNLAKRPATPSGQRDSVEEEEPGEKSAPDSEPTSSTGPAKDADTDRLIFSGEYTKAMNKDWHSGHFCCWQCDESLTGQRYVLRDDHPYCIKCYESVFANSCEECNKTIGIDSKDLSYKDKHWHEACFLCNKCRVSLVDKQFGSKLDKIFCGPCYDAQFASRCDGCGQIFKAGTKKMEYKTRQWHEPCFACCVCKTPIGTKSFIPREQEIYCATCYEEKFATRCVKCNKIITSGGVTYKNEPWHRECFTCTNCSTSLAGQRFTSRDEKPYCADCFGELFAKRCTACCKPITGIGGTRFISFEDRHWHNDCFICASCKTSLVGRGFITDAEDIICPECAKQKLM